MAANFLDTTVYKHSNDNNTILQTKVYFKPTNTHQLLHTKSFHPKHTCKGILKSQLIRFKRISSTWSDYNCTAKILFHSLVGRGYSWSLLRNMLKTVWFDENCRIKENRDNKEPFPIIMQYNSLGCNLSKQYKETLKRNNFFDKYKLISAYKNHSNLRRMLVRSELKPPRTGISNSYLRKIDNNKNNKFSLCKNPKCPTCKFNASESKCFSSSTFGSVHHVVGSMNCRSNNIIYLITCSKCNIQYVGETSRCLSERLTDHRSNIKQKKITPISIHFNEPGHSILRDLKAIVIEQISEIDNPLRKRKQQEALWQQRLGTIYPHGLNCYPTKTLEHVL